MGTESQVNRTVVELTTIFFKLKTFPGRAKKIKVKGVSQTKLKFKAPHNYRNENVKLNKNTRLTDTHRKKLYFVWWNVGIQFS